MQSVTFSCSGVLYNKLLEKKQNEDETLSVVIRNIIREHFNRIESSSVISSVNIEPTKQELGIKTRDWAKFVKDKFKLHGVDRAITDEFMFSGVEMPEDMRLVVWLKDNGYKQNEDGRWYKA